MSEALFVNHLFLEVLHNPVPTSVLHICFEHLFYIKLDFPMLRLR